MSTTRNTDGPLQPEGGSGEFHARIERDEPMTTKGHQPGNLKGNDAVPEFNVQQLPPGSAPSNRTFQPNPTDEAPPTDANPYASDTITGASSADVHTGLGHPGAGQSSQELRDGSAARGGLESVGASVNQSTINPHDPQFAGQRALDKDDATVGRSDIPSAEERLPESAETVAGENKIGRDQRAYGDVSGGQHGGGSRHS